MSVALAGVVLAMLQANAATPEAPQAQMITRPVWIRRPTGDDLAAVYPHGAVAARKNGQVRMVCTINDQGKLADCDVTEETPMGWGFGKAVLSLTDKFQMKPIDRDGSPVAGGRVSIPLVLLIAGGS